ncbi:hypothetical protein JM93_04370 [Roseibium hamelinense]|uniref:Uncharacterized protein n=1 Tax=Roseibium hamelinense TaxID=150831 RepID=A0A562SE35_9HYPH|nr:hypothetical protein [Roseibium hamelinense]TWI79531.1 hypothetical protein JM93_04370 [Roseibium hamelinense]
MAQIQTWCYSADLYERPMQGTSGDLKVFADVINGMEIFCMVDHELFGLIKSGVIVDRCFRD